MTRSFTCILCPNGCDIEAREEQDGKLTITGAGCPKGKAYVEQEWNDPRRTISSSVKVEKGELPLASVRLTTPVPKDYLFQVMEEIRKVQLEAPVHMGQVAIHHVLGLDSDVIVTRNVAVTIKS